MQISASHCLEASKMHDQVVTRLLPILAERPEYEFNIFNVMHHGTHEKQISNVFAWLLDANGTHIAFANDNGPIKVSAISIRKLSAGQSAEIHGSALFGPAKRTP